MLTFVLAALLAIAGASGAGAAENHLLLCRVSDDLDCITLQFDTHTACVEAAGAVAEELVDLVKTNAWCIDKLSGNIDKIGRLPDDEPIDDGAR